MSTPYESHKMLGGMKYANVQLRIQLPDSSEVHYCDITIDPVAVECFAPLPVNRELPGNIMDCAKAIEMIAERRQMANYIGHEIEFALLKFLASRDTVNGYPPK